MSDDADGERDDAGKGATDKDHNRSERDDEILADDPRGALAETESGPMGPGPTELSGVMSMRASPR